MAHDLAEGRPTEIEALQGRIIAMGREKMVSTPLNEALLRAVKQAEVSGFAPHTPESLRS